MNKPLQYLKNSLRLEDKNSRICIMLRINLESNTRRLQRQLVRALLWQVGLKKINRFSFPLTPFLFSH